MGGRRGGEGERTAVAAVALGRHHRRRERKKEQGRRGKGREVSAGKMEGKERKRREYRSRVSGEITKLPFCLYLFTFPI